jgi:hypothetical protein
LNKIGEIKAPVHINIEINKQFLEDISIVATLNSGNKIFNLLPTTPINTTPKNIILYTQIKNKDTTQIPFIYDLFLRLDKPIASGILEEIDAISIFIGNKLYYFSPDDILKFDTKIETGEHILYRIPDLIYSKSIFSKWINWYGDINLAIKLGVSFFLYPSLYITAYFFLICLLAYHRRKCFKLYSVIGKYKQLSEVVLFILIVELGLVLRTNGYLFHSSWADELYSAAITANPKRSFLSTFQDPGNPPFYNIILRCWFLLFGWSESNGLMFSIFLGTLSIISLYILVREYCGNKAALLASLFMATNNILIGYSRDMRCYILLVFLFSLLAYRYLKFIQNQTIKNIFIYTFLGILIANTHYYGILLVLINSVFFIFLSLHHQNCRFKKILLFFCGNVIIALSVFPYLILTAYKQTMRNQNFNSWIPKPGLVELLVAICIPILLFGFHIYKKTNTISGKEKTPDSKILLVNYTVIIPCLMYEIVYVLSLMRPILRAKYFIFLYPCLFGILSVIIVHCFANMLPRIFSILLIYFLVLYGYERQPGGGTDVYKETQSFITQDASSHPGSISSELYIIGHDSTGGKIQGNEYSQTELSLISRFQHYAEFYGYNQLPVFVPKEAYDILYVSPLKTYEEEMDNEMLYYGIPAKAVLKIIVNEKSTIYKKYAQGFDE